MSPNLTINLSPNNTVHLHHTRHADSIHLNQIKNDFQNQTLNYKLLTIEKETSNLRVPHRQSRDHRHACDRMSFIIIRKPLKIYLR